MTDASSPLQFPCEFPIKIFAAVNESLLSATRAVVEQHTGPLDDDRISERLSQNHNYVAITFTIEAQNREQLDAIYRDLTAREEVLMAL